MKYRKKPVIIEAILWTGLNLLEVTRFTGQKPIENLSDWGNYEDIVTEEGLKIHTLEGPMRASIGDYIIKGVKGEHYACKPDIFDLTYEIAEEKGE